MPMKIVCNEVEVQNAHSQVKIIKLLKTHKIIITSHHLHRTTSKHQAGTLTYPPIKTACLVTVQGLNSRLRPINLTWRAHKSAKSGHSKEDRFPTMI